MKGPTHRTNDLLQRVFRITCQPGGIRSIEWYLDRCEMLVHRENCRFFVFDPWNQHDEMRDKHDTETQYVNKMLRQLCEFVAVHKVIMIVVTHISAKSYDDEGGIRPFRIAQAHGSSHFGKMCDRGVCVARTRTLSGSNGEDRMIVRFDKAKDEESMGRARQHRAQVRPRGDGHQAGREVHRADPRCMEVLMHTRSIFASNASKYGHLNWLIFPLAPGAKVPMKGTAGLKEASANRAQIAVWSKLYPDSNLAVLCGASWASS